MATLVIRVGSRSDKGVRPNNEDTFVADRERDLYLVADGMGGQEAGEMASGLAAEIIPRVVQDRLAQQDPPPAAVQQALGRDRAGALVESILAAIARGPVKRGVRRLVAAGGETSGAVVDRLRIPGFLVGAEIAAGVPVLRAVGTRDSKMLLALKSGNFGAPDFFLKAWSLLS